MTNDQTKDGCKKGRCKEDVRKMEIKDGWKEDGCKDKE